MGRWKIRYHTGETEIVEARTIKDAFYKQSLQETVVDIEYITKPKKS